MPNESGQPDPRGAGATVGAALDSSPVPATGTVGGRAGPTDDATPAASATEPPVPTARELELEQARGDVLAAVAEWLVGAWEAPIVRAVTANAERALDQVDAFPALRAALRDLQAHAAATAEEAVGPLLDPGGPLRGRALTGRVEATVLDLVGLIGGPLKELGFDPLGGGLERGTNGFRLKAMTEHDRITAALRRFDECEDAVDAERAEKVERQHQADRIEVERLWRATADLP